MPEKKLLILGGTEEARRLAERLADKPGLTVITSLAGRTGNPSTIKGELRRGGFGGAAGLRGYLTAAQVSLVVDATHPFATKISETAAQVCSGLDIPLLRLARPAWGPSESDRWTSVPNADAAASKLPALGRRVFLTTGHKELPAFAGVRATWFLIRLIEPPQTPLPLQDFEVLLARGPFDVASESALLRDKRIEVLVTKNSGGTATAAKLVAARDLGLPVVMIERPRPATGESTGTVDEAAAWIQDRL